MTNPIRSTTLVADEDDFEVLDGMTSEVSSSSYTEVRGDLSSDDECVTTDEDDSDRDFGMPFDEYEPGLTRMELKGPRKISGGGFKSSRIERRHRVDPTLLRNTKARPLWVQTMADLSSLCEATDTNGQSKSSRFRAVRSFDEFRHMYLNQFRTWLVDSFASWYEVVSINLAPVNPNVGERFMARWATVARDGLAPRPVFHGTRNENVPRIYQHGLLTPQSQGRVHWYTKGIWTAPAASTSVGFSDTDMIFACAVLDGNKDMPMPWFQGAVDGIRAVDQSADDRATDSVKAKRKPAQVEKQLGRRQHRTTRNAGSKGQGTPQSNNNPRTTYVGTYAVVVEDEAKLCPLFEIHYVRSGSRPSQNVASRPKLLRNNPNTKEPEHADKTRAAVWALDNRDSSRGRDTLRKINRRQAELPLKRAQRTTSF